MRPNGRPKETIVFMVWRRLPRHRFNRFRFGGWSMMRYGICAATAASTMPPLPRAVVPPPEFALAVLVFGAALARSTACPRAVRAAVPVAAVASQAHHGPAPATRAEQHSMAVHGERSPSRHGQPRWSAAILLAADVTATAVCVCRRKLGW